MATAGRMTMELDVRLNRKRGYQQLREFLADTRLLDAHLIGNRAAKTLTNRLKKRVLSWFTVYGEAKAGKGTRR